MHNGIELSASLMCLDWLRAGQQLEDLRESPIDFLHVDIVDGKFATDFTMGSSIINSVIPGTQLKFDYHLMVEEPSRMFNTFPFREGEFLTIHQECSRNLHRDLVKIRQSGLRAGVALSPATPIELIEYVIEDIDLILLMTVNPGYMGQALVPQVIRKIEKLRALLNEMHLDPIIAVDGAVNPTTAPEMVAAGANRLILGSSGLFNKKFSIAEMCIKMCDAIDLGQKG